MDITHFTREAGEGEPLLLLHGNGESGAYFAAQIKALSPFYHVVALDTRGHGQTPRGESPFTLAQFAEDLKGFMDAREIERAHILGFSDGANIAMLFALRYPGRVDKLILNGGNLDPGGVRRRYQRPIELGYALAKRSAEKDPKAHANAEMLSLMVNEPHIAPESLSAITAPTLVIAGERDMIRREHTELIARSLPNAELCILPGNHFIAAKNPDAFNAAVLDFLRRES